MREEIRAARRERARDLRKTMTHAEKVLWRELRNRQLGGLRFKRQVGIDRYVVDFYCPERKLVVELDGEVHDSERQSEHDLNRDIFLRSQSLRILRIPNRDLYQDLDSVLRRIQEAAESPPPGPSPPVPLSRERERGNASPMAEVVQENPSRLRAAMLGSSHDVTESVPPRPLAGEGDRG